jgi:hypothetical protein
MLERTGNLTRLFWKIHYGNRRWHRVMFDFPRCQEVCSRGWYYIGVTVFGHSLIYRS